MLPELGLVLVTTGDNYDYNGPDVDALLISLLPELNPRLDQRFNGAWYNPATSGGVFLQGDLVSLHEWGSGRFRAVDCKHITFEIESDEISTTIPLTRLTGVCFEPP